MPQLRATTDPSCYTWPAPQQTLPDSSYIPPPFRAPPLRAPPDECVCFLGCLCMWPFRRRMHSHGSLKRQMRPLATAANDSSRPTELYRIAFCCLWSWCSSGFTVTRSCFGSSFTSWWPTCCPYTHYLAITLQGVRFFTQPWPTLRCSAILSIRICDFRDLRRLRPSRIDNFWEEW